MRYFSSINVNSVAKKRSAYSLICSMLFATLFYSAGPANSSIPIVKLSDGIEVVGKPIALAANETHFVTVGEEIQITDFSTRDVKLLPKFASEQIFTDVLALEDRFIAVGVLESSSVTITDPQGTFINPESITISSLEQKSFGLTRLKIIEFDSLSNILKEFIYESDAPIFPKSIQVFPRGIFINGEMASSGGFQGFIARVDLENNSIFLKQFGLSSTSINKMANAQVAYGASRESLAQSKLQGLSDGVIFFLRENLELARTVRSFAAASLRDWSSVSTNHLAVGTVEKSGKSEVAITKFNGNGAPQWTNRIAGGTSPVVDGVRVGFITKSKISSIPGFTPKRSTAVFLTFNKKGVIRAVSTVPALALRDLSDGYALIQLQRGPFQLIRLAP